MKVYYKYMFGSFFSYEHFEDQNYWQELVGAWVPQHPLRTAELMADALEIFTPPDR